MFCLNGATLVGIIAGSAFGTVVILLMFFTILIFFRRRRDRTVIGTNKDRTLKTDLRNGRHRGRTHYAVYEKPSRNREVGQSTPKGAPPVTGDTVVTVLEEGNGTISNGNVVRNTKEHENDQNGRKNNDWPLAASTEAWEKHDAIALNFPPNCARDLRLRAVGGNSKGQGVILEREPGEKNGIAEGDRVLGMRLNFEDTSAELIMDIIRHADPLHFTLLLEKGSSKHCSTRNGASPVTSGLPNGSPLQKWISFDDSMKGNGQNAAGSLGHSQNIVSELIDENQATEKLTVTAEISALPQTAKTVAISSPDAKVGQADGSSPSAQCKKLKDPYEGLTYEERMQIIRLSYEEPDISRSTPNLFIGTIAPVQKQVGSREPEASKESSVQRMPSSTSKIPVPTSLKKRRSSAQESTSIELESAKDSGTTAQDSAPSRERKNSSGTLTSSFCSSSEDSGRASSPEGMKKEKVSDETMDTEEFHKLLYFQKQLEKQHQELVSLGLQVPSWQQENVGK